MYHLLIFFNKIKWKLVSFILKIFKFIGYSMIFLTIFVITRFWTWGSLNTNSNIQNEFVNENWLFCDENRMKCWINTWKCVAIGSKYWDKLVDDVVFDSRDEMINLMWDFISNDKRYDYYISQWLTEEEIREELLKKYNTCKK